MGFPVPFYEKFYNGDRLACQPPYNAREYYNDFREHLRMTFDKIRDYYGILDNCDFDTFRAFIINNTGGNCAPPGPYSMSDFHARSFTGDIVRQYDTAVDMMDMIQKFGNARGFTMLNTCSTMDFYAFVCAYTSEK